MNLARFAGRGVSSRSSSAASWKAVSARSSASEPDIAMMGHKIDLPTQPSCGLTCPSPSQQAGNSQRSRQLADPQPHTSRTHAPRSPHAALPQACDRRPPRSEPAGAPVGGSCVSLASISSPHSKHSPKGGRLRARGDTDRCRCQMGDLLQDFVQMCPGSAVWRVAAGVSSEL
jgi:hypothetical protein